jgi:uncharacterized membrane protein YqjE
MAALPSMLQDLGGAAGRLGEHATDLVKDRVELLALELREERVRSLQMLMLGLAGTLLVLAGIGLLVAAALYALPAEWRLTGLVVAALATLVVGAAVLCSLRQRLAGRGTPFAQTLAELEKDKACFSTRN